MRFVRCDRCDLPGSWRNEDHRFPILQPMLVEDLDLRDFVGPPVLMCEPCIRYSLDVEERRLRPVDWTELILAGG